MSGPVDVAAVLAAVRQQAPLVHALTASVSMPLVANALLAAGARPLMTASLSEAPCLVGAADGLLVNLGTLAAETAQAVGPTVDAAREAGVPVVLDPAAVSERTRVRTPLARTVLAASPAVVRANASELLVLAGTGPGGRGADSLARPDDAAVSARGLAADHETVVAVSGEVDLVTDGRRTVRLANGHPLLTRVTGTGCTLGALTTACCAVATPFDAAVAATAWLTVAAEVAAATSRGPGSFAVALLDELALLQPGEIAAAVRWA